MPDNHSAPGADSPVTRGLPDVQGRADVRRIAIDRVGVKDVVYPITLKTPDGGCQSTVAKINMYVSLPAEQKGTHMSRFLEVLNEYADGIRPDRLREMCGQLRTRLQAEVAHLEMEFTYFIRKFAPVTREPGLMDYQVRFTCESDGTDDFVMSVTAPATSLCPCSREISSYGAHNQRCMITADIRSNSIVWIEELAAILEASASCGVYSVLKRPDEKHVTEVAYDNPKFVEDIVRDLALALEDDDRITWYHVRSENFESIHSHNAFAEITRKKG
ncbi:MAG: GTP cyclohydrolase FolE2 [Phycisphaerales bacterium]